MAVSKASAYARLGVEPVRLPREIVSLYIHKESTANTIKVVEDIKSQIDGPIRDRLAKIGLALDHDLRIEIIFDFY